MFQSTSQNPTKHNKENDQDTYRTNITSLEIASSIWAHHELSYLFQDLYLVNLMAFNPVSWWVVQDGTQLILSQNL
jgi:hypothetical protein